MCPEATIVGLDGKLVNTLFSGDITFYSDRSTIRLYVTSNETISQLLPFWGQQLLELRKDGVAGTIYHLRDDGSQEPVEGYKFNPKGRHEVKLVYPKRIKDRESSKIPNVRKGYFPKRTIRY
ncbi:hypothetical protein M1403_00975 [Patescibacteria group bacterium]|nr:hypothetical protein [Patescibacteria group bacterium]